MSSLERVDVPGLCLVLGDVWATKSAILLLQGLPVSPPGCSPSISEPSTKWPGSPWCQNQGWERPASLARVFPPLLPALVSLLPNKHPCQNS